MEVHLKVKKMKTIAIYARVSTKEQTTDNQVIRLTEYVTARGYQFDVFTEVESTRKTRPVKKLVLDLLRKGIFDGVIVYKLDRWARSSRELLLEIEELTSKGIEFHSYSENLDFTSATGKLHFSILSAFAEFERELIRERTLEGLNRAKAQGKKLGRPKGAKDTKKRRTGGYYKR
jgi:DNA invertase Pin-like site-specific DNA recombinase